MMNRLSGNPKIGFSPVFKPFSLNIGGKLFYCNRPLVMGILNCTPDSFYEKSRAQSLDEIERRIISLIKDGSDIIDIGGYSTRPGAQSVSAETEIKRIKSALNIAIGYKNEILISVDTFRGDVAEYAIANGADIINDVSAGEIDNSICKIVSRYQVPYILTHSEQSHISAIQSINTDSGNEIIPKIFRFLSHSIDELKDMGMKDIILDPGFGFGKTLMQNYEILRDLPMIEEGLGLPILVGLSRKSMIYQALGISSDEALQATTTATTLALLNGASIIRTHDPLSVRQSIEIIKNTYPSYF